MPSAEHVTEPDRELLGFAATIITAYVSKNAIPATEFPTFIKAVHGTLAGLFNSTGTTAGTSQKPAVPIKKSVSRDYIVCLEDGKKLKMLKRYLRSRYDLSPDQY